MSDVLSYRSPDTETRNDSWPRLAVGLLCNALSLGLAVGSAWLAYDVAESHPRTVGFNLDGLAVLVVSGVTLVIQALVFLPVAMFAARRRLKSKAWRSLIGWTALLGPATCLISAIGALSYMSARRPGSGF